MTDDEKTTALAEGARADHIMVNGHHLSIPTTDDVRSQIEDTEEWHSGHEGLYGPMFDAWLSRHDAEVWEQGRRAGGSVAMRRMSDEPNAPDAVNPYRAAAVGQEQG